MDGAKMTSSITINDARRREVADILRSMSDEEVVRTIRDNIEMLSNEEMGTMLFANACECVALRAVGFDTHTVKDYLNLLADLIDRPGGEGAGASDGR